MPRRTAKINHPDNDNIELESVEAEQLIQDDLPEEEGRSPLGLDNLRDLIFLGKMRDQYYVFAIAASGPKGLRWFSGVDRPPMKILTFSFFVLFL